MTVVDKSNCGVGIIEINSVIPTICGPSSLESICSVLFEELLVNIFFTYLVNNSLFLYCVGIPRAFTSYRNMFNYFYYSLVRRGTGDGKDSQSPPIYIWL